MVDLLERRPDLPVYCGEKCARFLTGQYRREWPVTTVKTGDRLDLGGYSLLFIEAPMLHWPDSMFAYVEGLAALLPNDAFGQHYVTGGLFNDQADPCVLWREAMKYYANIISPYAKMARAKIKQIKDMGLPIELICPSHGVIWRDNPGQILAKYEAWADNYKENQVLIIYDTMWHETRIMAEALGRGVTKAGVVAKVVNAARTDVTHILTEAFRSAGILAGSPTVNNGISHGMAAALEGLKHLKLQGKRGAAFGSYGWSGEGPDILQKRLEEAGIQIAGGPFKQLHLPEEETLKQLTDFGRQFAQESVAD
jgi:flavorubredoxin